MAVAFVGFGYGYIQHIARYTAFYKQRITIGFCNAATLRGHIGYINI